MTLQLEHHVVAIRLGHLTRQPALLHALQVRLGCYTHVCVRSIRMLFVSSFVDFCVVHMVGGGEMARLVLYTM